MKSSIQDTNEKFGGPIVQQALAGQTAIIVAYGQVGSGKTTTTLGGDEENDGLLNYVLTNIIDDGCSIDFKAIEIYGQGNEPNFYDLLADVKHQKKRKVYTTITTPRKGS
eukprot:UN33652